MCEYCKETLYWKTVQYMRPAMAPLTREQELRDELLDLTGEIYVPVPKNYCRVCGEQLQPPAQPAMEGDNNG